MKLDPIVWACGGPEVHEAADRYNQRLSSLHDLEDDLRRAWAWNGCERFQYGFWRDTISPPIPTGELSAKIESLRHELTLERARIAKLGTIGNRLASERTP